LGEVKDSILNTDSKEVVQQILEKTALLEECTLRLSTISLLQQVENDTSERSRFIDQSTLRGLMATIMSLGSFIKSQEWTSAGNSFAKQEVMMQRAVETLVYVTRMSSNIARTNGESYKNAMTSLIENGTSKTSLAVETKRILDYGKLEKVCTVQFHFGSVSHLHLVF
jgi:hypothetical protein